VPLKFTEGNFHALRHRMVSTLKARNWWDHPRHWRRWLWEVGDVGGWWCVEVLHLFRATRLCRRRGCAAMESRLEGHRRRYHVWFRWNRYHVPQSGVCTRDLSAVSCTTIVPALIGFTTRGIDDRRILGWCVAEWSSVHWRWEHVGLFG